MHHLLHSNIFITDDDMFTLHVYEKHIRNLGYTNVTCFESGTACLNELNTKPNVIFLDHEMADVNGFEVLKKIKRFNPNIYVVMVSGQEDMNTAIDSLKYGAFDYIIKGDDTLLKIEKVLAKIEEINKMIEKSKPSLFKAILRIL